MSSRSLPQRLLTKSYPVTGIKREILLTFRISGSEATFRIPSFKQPPSVLTDSRSLYQGKMPTPLRHSLFNSSDKENIVYPALFVKTGFELFLLRQPSVTVPLRTIHKSACCAVDAASRLIFCFRQPSVTVPPRTIHKSACCAVDAASRLIFYFMIRALRS